MKIIFYFIIKRFFSFSSSFNFFFPQPVFAFHFLIDFLSFTVICCFLSFYSVERLSYLSQALFSLSLLSWYYLADKSLDIFKYKKKFIKTKKKFFLEELNSCKSVTRFHHYWNNSWKFSIAQNVLNCLRDSIFKRFYREYIRTFFFQFFSRHTMMKSLRFEKGKNIEYNIIKNVRNLFQTYEKSF